MNNNYNSVNNGTTKEKLVEELVLARQFGNWEKAKDIARQLKEMDQQTQTEKDEETDINKKLDEAYAKGDRAKVEQLMEKLSKKNTIPTKNEKFGEDFEEIKKQLSSADTSKMTEQEARDLAEKLKTFLSNDVQTYKNDQEKYTAELDEAKNKQITKLQDQLKGVLSNEPSLKEYFSLERRRLASIKNHFDDLKTKDKIHYPKNVLIYAMTVTNGFKLFGVREKIKRGKIKLTRNRQSDNIKNEIAKLEKKLQINKNDSPQRILTKQFILEQIKEAKQDYLKQVQQKVGL